MVDRRIPLRVKHRICNLKFSSLVKYKRDAYGMSQREFARLIGLKEGGERTVRGWESGEHEPSESNETLIRSLKVAVPYKDSREHADYRFIDLFAGIGGMRLALQQLGGRCVFSSEWDKFAQQTYASNFGELPHGDITKISETQIPDHEILLAGFPCQAFSNAGHRKGFADTRGTLFFDIQRILVEKRPRMFLLENVKQLRGHDKGRTLSTIIGILRGDCVDIPDEIAGNEAFVHALKAKLNYSVSCSVLRSNDFGLPQKRERLYIVGFDKDYFGDIELEGFRWPEPLDVMTNVGSILERDSEKLAKYTISQRLYDGHVRRKKEHQRKGNGFGFSVVGPNDRHTNTLSARYYKDGSEILIDQSEKGLLPRKLTPRECARLQGFPEDFIVDAVSEAQVYKQFGNSVSVPVIRQIAGRMLELDRAFSKNRSE
jgi:DNA (cytosine-5)-methyltransferase 1